MRCKFSHEHNVEQNENIRALQHSIHDMKHNRLEPNYANYNVYVVIKLYMNCGIIAVVMDIILSIIGNFLSTAQKHTINREIFVYENIHVLYIRVNKFSRVPDENILTRKFVKLKLLCMYCRLSDY